MGWCLSYEWSFLSPQLAKIVTWSIGQMGPGCWSTRPGWWSTSPGWWSTSPGWWSTTTVDGRNPANQLRLVVSPILYEVLAPSEGGWEWDFWTINSIKKKTQSDEVTCNICRHSTFENPISIVIYLRPNVGRGKKMSVDVTSHNEQWIAVKAVWEANVLIKARKNSSQHLFRIGTRLLNISNNRLPFCSLTQFGQLRCLTVWRLLEDLSHCQCPRHCRNLYSRWPPVSWKRKGAWARWTVMIRSTWIGHEHHKLLFCMPRFLSWNMWKTTTHREKVT